MRVTTLTRNRLAFLREARDMQKEGWERLDDTGGMLWQISQGYRIGQKIVDVKIARCGRFVWIKIEDPNGHQARANDLSDSGAGAK